MCCGTHNLLYDQPAVSPGLESLREPGRRPQLLLTAALAALLLTAQAGTLTGALGTRR